MFTPPPSPLPSLLSHNVDVNDPIAEISQSEKTLPTPVIKRQYGRKTKWATIMAPLALILITLSTRYIVNPPREVLSYDRPTPTERHPAWHHKRNSASTLSQASTDTSSLIISSTPVVASTSAASTSTSFPTETIPTIPTNAILPTPFPQPWDSDIGQNYSSQTCLNFFSNMTNTAAFRSCRPFSLLLMSSSALVDAQENLTALNSIVWGTCNTTLSEDQCISNMAWFANALQTACSVDLAAQNNLAVNALIGLEAFPLMYSAGCLANPATDSYCYVEAAFNSNPSDLYLYQVPLGLALPNTTEPTCSACGQSIFSLYQEALHNSSQYKALAQTYDGAANLARASCGTDYASLPSNAGDVMVTSTVSLAAFTLFILWTLCSDLSTLI